MKTTTEIAKEPNRPKISREKWFNHFSNLHSGKCKKSLVSEGLDKNDSDLGSELNAPFSKTEFLNAVKGLKHGKSVGYDSISNEMITNSPDAILDLLLKFINVCLKKHLIPNSFKNYLLYDE